MCGCIFLATSTSLCIECFAMNDSMVVLSSRVQQLMVDLYTGLRLCKSVDDCLRNRVIDSCLYSYSMATEFVTEEDQFGLLVMIKSVKDQLTEINSLLLMAFQTGMVNADTCIDYGSRYEVVKAELMVEIIRHEKIIAKNMHKQDDDEE